MAIVNLYHNVKGAPDRVEIEDKPLKSGGEGTVYRSKDGLWAVKIYHPGKVKPEKRPFLETITKLGTYLTHEEEQFLCWPKGVVQTVNGNPEIGCSTKFISLPKLSDVNQSRYAADRQIQSGKSWSHYLQIARGIARTVTFLHKNGAVHADLSNNNFFVNPNNCDVILFDLDGLIIEGKYTRGYVLGTKGMIAREVMLKETEPNKLSECHSLAVQILQTLLFRNVFKPLITYDDTDMERDDEIGWGLRLTFSEDPKDKRNCPKNLGLPLTRDGELSYKVLTPGLQKLTERACIEGLRSPAKRPSAQDWIDTLSYALDELYLCQRCHLHFPYPHWIQNVKERSCPFCGQQVAGNLPSVISLYEPYEPRGHGKYSFKQRYLVMSQGWQLFSDVLDTKRDTPMSRKKEVSTGQEVSTGHVTRDGKRRVNYLVNDEGGTWRAQLQVNGAILKAGKGESLPLISGTIINPGDGRPLLVVIE